MPTLQTEPVSYLTERAANPGLTSRLWFYIFRIMEANTAVRSLGALAQATRLEIFRLLVREGPDGVPAGEIGERLAIPAPTLSFHLAQLARAGLVLSRRDGRSIRYAANFGGMNALLTYLTEDCCQGRPEICSITAARAGCAEPASAPARKSLRKATGGSSHETPASARRR